MSYDDDGPSQCHFCGEYVNDGLDPKGERHWLSDCRPDLVQHEVGPLCTWPPYEPPNEDLNDKLPSPNCYAYRVRESNEWGTEHTHFYPDGPM